LKELALSRPSEVMSRYSISAKNVGSTHVAFGFFSGLLNLLLGLTTVQRFPDFARRCAIPPGPNLAHVAKSSFLLAEIQSCNARRIFDEADHREFSLVHGFDF
jgi:hypothetical protein